MGFKLTTCCYSLCRMDVFMQKRALAPSCGEAMQRNLSENSVSLRAISRPWISCLPLLVPRMRLAEHKQTPPPANNETVFAAALQGRLGLHPRGGLDAGKMVTLSQERARGGGAGREGLEGADAGGCRGR
ncbi:hypothetical protein EYF80_048609 [Liparis tanakae]|uniref:Uncharacterized protein n=1 Tax=Liparis tanakae TaxID=230148 RepID=A0A4Z2FJ47_9TELE|nr:hypothetical protein EYF80_048609 [Liparis tanakae]